MIAEEAGITIENGQCKRASAALPFSPFDSFSVHGWFNVQGLFGEEMLEFFRYAVLLGADPATWTRSQFVRMPDGTRQSGREATGVLSQSGGGLFSGILGGRVKRVNERGNWPSESSRIQVVQEDFRALASALRIRSFKSLSSADLNA